MAVATAPSAQYPLPRALAHDQILTILAGWRSRGEPFERLLVHPAARPTLARALLTNFCQMMDLDS